jgi:hypothetical protein
MWLLTEPAPTMCPWERSLEGGDEVHAPVQSALKLTDDHILGMWLVSLKT